uniref:Kinase n=1 Tax=Pyxicephalus adspersus TaxID=30357 RepID=A0AAV2ZEE3_PYXAD|nr:TPA: hypothetical protein GDO54_005273 [Pyxicephalus adspersus]
MIPTEVTSVSGMNHAGGVGEPVSSPSLSSGRKRLSVGELRLYFEARCSAERDGLREPRRRRRMGSGSWHRSNGEASEELRRGSWQSHVIPQLMVTNSEEPPPPSPDLPVWGDMRSEGLLKLTNRRLSVSSTSLSSTGSSSVLEDSEDDLLSDSESKSQGNVDLEHSEEQNLNKSWQKLRTIVNIPVISPFKRRWVQLAGHNGSFKAAAGGTILKRYSENEKNCFEMVMNDVLASCVPTYHGVTERDKESYIQLDDLLNSFDEPCVMDCKMGVRCNKNPLNPTGNIEPITSNAQEGVMKMKSEGNEFENKTYPKCFYLQKGDGTCNTNFKTTKSRDQVHKAFLEFIDGNKVILHKYLNRLQEIRTIVESSDFFKHHEVIGSSLLFVHDKKGKCNVWLIDFGKTTLLPDGQTLNHRIPWQEGNREDGYLYGFDNLIDILSSLAS